MRTQRQHSSTELTMFAIQQHTASRLWRQLFAIVATVSMLIGNAAAATAQKTFAAPDEAVNAFIAEIKAHDAKAVLAILGPGGNDILYSGDKVADRTRAERFLAAYDEAHKL